MKALRIFRVANGYVVHAVPSDDPFPDDSNTYVYSDIEEVAHDLPRLISRFLWQQGDASAKDGCGANDPRLKDTLLSGVKTA